MTTSKKIITVFGATGTQGGSVARSLLQNPSFHVRGLTRNASSPRALALAALGIEVIQANGFNPSDLAPAFANAWGAFVNINSDDPELKDGTLEPTLGRTIADAALAAGVHHIIFSGTVSTAAVANLPIAMYDNKAGVQAYIASLPFPKSSFVMAGWYMENQLLPELADFVGGFPFKRNEEGVFEWRMPKWGGERAEKVPFVDMERDFGDVVHGVFLAPEEEGLVQVASEGLTYAEWLRIFSEVTGKPTRHVPIPHEELQTYGVKQLEELAGLFKFCDLMDGRYFGEKLDLARAERLKRLVQRTVGKEETGLGNWRAFVERHREEFGVILEWA